MSQAERKSISPKDWKILIAESGGYCAFPACPEYLVSEDTEDDDEVFLGEIAHIVGSFRQGPRGESGLTEEDRSKHDNLVLLCNKHHKIVDGQKNHYSVPVMIQMKADQKTRNKPKTKIIDPVLMKQDTVFSTLLPVSHMPQTVFSAVCKFSASERDELNQSILWPKDKMELAPFQIHNGELYWFHDLRSPRNPFSKCVDMKKVEHKARLSHHESFTRAASVV